MCLPIYSPGPRNEWSWDLIGRRFRVIRVEREGAKKASEKRHTSGRVEEPLEDVLGYGSGGGGHGVELGEKREFWGGEARK